MDCFNRFKRKMELNGGNLRAENIMNSRKLISAVFEDDPSFMLGVYRWELGRKTYEDQTPIKIRMYERAYSNANGWTTKFQTMYDTEILEGDVIYDSVHDFYLICTEVFCINETVWQGKFTQCNWILKWQNHKTGYIYEYPCYVINSTQYNSGEKNNAVITWGSTQHQVTITADENTIPIKTPQRFFLDRDMENPVSYIVSQNDTTHKYYSKKGLVRITLLQCATNNNTDRPDLGVCDYVSIEELSSGIINEDNVGIRISYDTKTIKSGGDMQKFKARFYNDMGNIVDDVHLNWNVICNFKDEMIIEIQDNIILIGVDNDDYVDEEFKVECSDDTGRFRSSILLKVESLL